MLFPQFPQKDEIYKRIFFQPFSIYSERTITSTETNDTSKESSDTQLFEARKFRAWHYQKGSTPTCCKKTLKKKVNLTEESQDAKKKFNRANLISSIMRKVYAHCF